MKFPKITIFATIGAAVGALAYLYYRRPTQDDVEQDTEHDLEHGVEKDVNTDIEIDIAHDPTRPQYMWNVDDDNDSTLGFYETKELKNIPETRELVDLGILFPTAIPELHRNCQLCV